MTEATMLHEIEVLEARRIAELAAAARDARDQALAPVPEAGLGEPRPARGPHHTAGGFSPENTSARRALRQAVEDLPSDIRRKIWAAMRIGCGDYAKGDWGEAMMAAGNLSDETVIDDLVEEADLHVELMKGLYEMGAAEPWTPPS
jgi:hypothetical protein